MDQREIEFRQLLLQQPVIVRPADDNTGVISRGRVVDIRDDYVIIGDERGSSWMIHAQDFGWKYRVFYNGPEFPAPAEGATTGITESNSVNHPLHYNQDPSGVECIQIVRHRTYNIGNAIKYLWRAGLKDEDTVIEDLEKAAWSIRDEIDRLKGEV